MSAMPPGFQDAVGVPSSRTPAVAHEPPYELKFLVSEAKAAEVAVWASRHLAADPHAGASRSDGYRVTSLYLDTPALDVFHRRGSFGRAKYRLRRYDSAPFLFLERKCKVKGRVRKRRTKVEDGELDQLRTLVAPAGWPGRWFGRRVLARNLRPTCLISYERVARLGDGLHGPIRLTIDHDFLCRPASRLALPALDNGESLPFFMRQGVVELKYRTSMPSLFKTLLRDLELSPSAASKYRAAVMACDLRPAPSEETDA
jgi:VTC domain